MPNWLIWLLVGLVAWTLLSVPLSLFLGRLFRLSASLRADGEDAGEGLARPPVIVAPSAPRRILIVDDEPALRNLLRTTLAGEEFEVAEAENARQASDLARFWRPRVVILDVQMPDLDGPSFCAELKRKPAFGAPAVVLLTGSDLTEADAARAGADALMRKPFSPLELIGVVDRMSGAQAVELHAKPESEASEQMLLYARDLGRLVEIERLHRRVVQDAYRETVAALANALEAKDTGTRRHSLRVRDYAVQLTAAIAPTLLSDPSLEYGFLLHDVGKIGVPNELLEKRGPLNARELEVMRQHTVIGAEMLADVMFLQGEGLNVIRSHHERWDGTGYPDHLAGEEIPLSARIFAVADAVDAMTVERPYRPLASWDAAAKEISAQSGRQFDPAVVAAFMKENRALRRVYEGVGKAA